jgi:23S rRNA (guanosine2251-2'-O)-methyltransferase
VEEAFVAARPARRLLVVPQRRQALERLVLHATSLRIPVVEVEGGTLTSIAGFDGHQGIALVVEPRAYVGLDDILARSVERGEAPFLLVLDSLEDPQNVGTLLRSAEAAGVHGVIFPTHHQAPLTPAAVKASAGAVEHLLLAPVDDLPAALSDLRIRGLRIAAAEADAPLTADEADLRGPLAIVVGSEGQGLAPAVRRRADLAIRIPMRGSIASLNAAVAGSILLFAAVAQRPAPTPVGKAAAEAPEAGLAAEPPRAADQPSPPAESTAVEALPAGGPSSRKRRAGRPAATTAEPAAETRTEPTATAAPKAKATRAKTAETTAAKAVTARAKTPTKAGTVGAKTETKARAKASTVGAKTETKARAKARTAAAKTEVKPPAKAATAGAKSEAKPAAKAATAGAKARTKTSARAAKSPSKPAATTPKAKATRAKAAPKSAPKSARKPVITDADESSGDDLLPGGPAPGDPSPVA